MKQLGTQAELTEKQQQSCGLVYVQNVWLCLYYFERPAAYRRLSLAVGSAGSCGASSGQQQTSTTEAPPAAAVQPVMMCLLVRSSAEQR